ncbi:MAG: hypothetical protein WBA57_02025 [Elainellaceae cyanobacterium]
MNTEQYFTPFEWVLERFCFNYLGHSYTGRGILQWNPEDGFHIEGPLKRRGFSQPESIAMGRVRVLSDAEKSSIYMKPWYFRCGFTPKISLVDREDILSQKRLSINFEKACFLTFSKSRDKSDNINGHSLYEIGDTDFLFDFVDRGGIQISGNILIGGTRDQRGIFHAGGQGEKIQGFSKRKKYLELYWSFPKSNFTKAYCWRWAENVKHSLSILLGRTVEILSREMTCDNKTRLEILKAQSVDSLNFLSLFNYKYGKDESSKNKILFLTLTDFFASKRDFYQVGINIFKQVAEASRQNNWQTRELLLSTILEAALRNIENQPFHNKKMTGWNVGKGLQKFLGTYLADESWMMLGCIPVWA